MARQSFELLTESTSLHVFHDVFLNDEKKLQHGVAKLYKHTIEEDCSEIV